MNKPSIEIDKVVSKNAYPLSQIPVIFNWVDETALNNLSELIAQFFQVPVTAIAFNANNTQWLISKIGIEQKCLSIGNRFFRDIVSQQGVLEIPDISKTAYTNDIPVLLNQNIQFYASISFGLINDFVGTVFIADFEPKKLTEQEKKAFNTFANNINSTLKLNKINFQKLEKTNTPLPQLNSAVKQISESILTDYENLSDDSNTNKSYWLEVNTQAVFNNKKLVDIDVKSELIDITEKKNREANILTLISVMNSIFNAISFAVIFTDTDGIIRRINKAGLDLIEYTNDEVIGRTPEFFHDSNEIMERTLALSLELGQVIMPGKDTFVLKACLENKVDANEWTYITKSGRRIPILLSITCVRNSNNDIIGHLGVAEDYRAKKRAQQELIDAKNAAELAVYAKDSFLANMSHEIRTPLNAIIGFTELLSQSKLDKVQHDFINHIQVAGDNLLLIINDILDLSKIESGQLVIESYPFSITDTLQHVQNLLKIKANQNNNDFSLSIAEDIPEFILGDKGRINQILVNLAGNAIKFTKNGKVSISLEKIDENTDFVTLQFTVSDTGIGIPEDKLQAIFDRFTQAEASTTRKFGGSGLGLNIVKQLVSMQNGKLSVQSTLGKGSEFQFIITFQKVDCVSIENLRDNTLNAQSLGSLSILLCEDNHLNQILAKNVIQKFGFNLDIVNNGQEGINALINHHYDIVLMDLQMPVVDGYQATIHIRNVLKSNIPIIAMTAHSLVGEQQKCFDIGMNAYLAKPFKQIELLEKIQSVLDKNRFDEKKLLHMPQEISTHTSGQATKLDLSYLETFSEGNEEFILQMIKLFTQQVPKDLILLEQKIAEQDYPGIKSVAHHMKSSLAMFKLDHEVQFLQTTEHNAKNSIISSNIESDFIAFKKNIEQTLLIMSDY